MIRVGVIEDNLDFRAELTFHLKLGGISVSFESDGTSVDQLLSDPGCDVLLLDLYLPTEDGLKIAQRVRKKFPLVGIVMLTARGCVHERVSGLQDGADVYLTKPADMAEVVAVVQSVDRRLHAQLAVRDEVSSWTLDLQRGSLFDPEGQEVMLTVNEMRLLRQLASAKGKSVDRKTLAHAIGRTNLDFDDRRLEVAFSRLRIKIESIAPDANVLRSVRGQGYMFTTLLRVLGEN